MEADMDKGTRTRKLEIRKIDGYGNGKNDCLVTVTLALRDTQQGPAFSALCDVWEPSRRDILLGGQAFDTVRSLHPDIMEDRLFATVFALWEKHHLNDLHAGTPAQENAIDEAIREDLLPERAGFDLKVSYLKLVGLYVDGGHRYGSSWLYREIPEADLALIEDMIADPDRHR
jgi:hypothetical protein